MDYRFIRTLNKLGVYEITLIKKIWRLKKELNINCKEKIGNLWDFESYLLLSVCPEVTSNILIFALKNWFKKFFLKTLKESFVWKTAEINTYSY